MDPANIAAETARPAGSIRKNERKQEGNADRRPERGVPKYILCIYELSRQELNVSCVSIAKKLNVTKPSVSNMLERLMKQGLLVKEKYGKTYLTDKGYLAARELKENMESPISFFTGIFPCRKKFCVNQRRRLISDV